MLISSHLGTDFTCEVEPGHFYFIRREYGSPAFRQRTNHSSQDCGGVGANTLRGNGGAQTSMTEGCLKGFRKYMADYGVDNSELESIAGTIKRSVTELVQFQNFVVCRRKCT